MGAAMILQFPIGVLTARYLGPEGKGALHIVVVSLMVSTALGNLGLGQASIYFVGRNRKCLPAVVANLLLVTVIISIAFIGIGWLALEYNQPPVYRRLPMWLWVAVAALVPIGLLQSLLMQVLSAVLRIIEINVVQVATVAVQLLLFAFFVIAMNKGLTGAFLAYALACFQAAVILIALVRREGAYPQRSNLPLLRASLSYGLKAYLTALMRLLNLRLDALLVASLASGGLAAAGIYSVATSLAEIILFIPTSIRLGLFPVVAASSNAESSRLTSTACRQTMLISVMVASIAAAFGPLIIRWLYGTQFVAAALPLMILLPGVVLLAQVILFQAYFDGSGNPGISGLSTVLSVILTVILDVALIPPYGSIGAAVASTCAYTAEFVVAGLVFIRRTGLSWNEVLVFQKGDVDYYARMFRQHLFWSKA
jgi:O-antigen/teichoic acid export membrane protein